MNRTGRMFVNAALILAGSVLAALLVKKLTPNVSWAAFVGWVIFFFAVQSPFLLASEESQRSCTAWLSRRRRRG
jgi:hypothetical protein